MHVVGMGTDGTGGVIYRAEHPMRALAERGHHAVFHRWDQRDAPPPFEQLRQADVVHMWRLFRAPARRLAGALREAGVAVVFDNDDDMTRVPKNSPAYREMKAARAQVAQELGAMLRAADMVTTTCGELAGRLRRLGGGDVRVVENYVEAGFLRERRPSGDGVTVGWVAGQEHRGDLKDLRLRRTLEALLESHPRVSLVCVGVDVGVRSERYTHHRFIPLPQLPDVISTFDLALAPLADVSFNRVRSNVKLKEYTACGVPWLASPIGPYKELGEAQGGRSVPDHGWPQALAELVADDAARDALAARAEAWGRTQTVDGNVEEWEAVFAAAAERAGRVVGAAAAERRSGAARAADAGSLAPGARRSGMVIPRPSPPGAAATPGAGAGAAKPRRGLFRRRSR